MSIYIVLKPVIWAMMFIPAANDSWELYSDLRKSY